MAKLSPSQEEELRAAFDLFDSDHSGKISKTELKKVLNALNIKATNHEVEKLLQQMDTNNSGDIDYNEFKKVMAKPFSKRYTRKELKNAFENLDRDKSGFITTDELGSTMTRLGKRLNHQELQNMVKSIDLNNDGKISFDEFCRLFD